MSYSLLRSLETCLGKIPSGDSDPVKDCPYYFHIESVDSNMLLPFQMWKPDRRVFQDFHYLESKRT